MLQSSSLISILSKKSFQSIDRVWNTILWFELVKLWRCVMYLQLVQHDISVSQSCLYPQSSQSRITCNPAEICWISIREQCSTPLIYLQVCDCSVLSVWFVMQSGISTNKQAHVGRYSTLQGRYRVECIDEGMGCCETTLQVLDNLTSSMMVLFVVMSIRMQHAISVDCSHCALCNAAFISLWPMPTRTGCNAINMWAALVVCGRGQCVLLCFRC